MTNANAAANAAVAITVEQLETMLADLKPGANMITIGMATTPKMRKTGNDYFGKIRKHATANVQIQLDYERAVNAQRVREGNTDIFKAQPRTWGERVGKTCLIEHKGKKYMAFRALRCLKSTLRDLEGHFLTNDVLETVKGFMSKSKSKTQKTDKEIVWRTVSLDNVTRININKKRYKIIE